MTGAPIVAPLFVDDVAAGKPRVVVDGLDGHDPRAVKVRVVDQHGGHLADLTHLWANVAVDVPADGPVRFTFDGYLTSDTALPQNAERVVVDADGTFCVATHPCPHLLTFGERECRWCGEEVVDDVEVSTAGEFKPGTWQDVLDAMVESAAADPLHLEPFRLVRLTTDRGVTWRPMTIDTGRRVLEAQTWGARSQRMISEDWRIDRDLDALSPFVVTVVADDG